MTLDALLAARLFDELQDVEAAHEALPVKCNEGLACASGAIYEPISVERIAFAAQLRAAGHSLNPELVKKNKHGSLHREANDTSFCNVMHASKLITAPAIPVVGRPGTGARSKGLVAIALSLSLLLPSVALAAAAPAYPNRIIRMIVPFSIGGGTDVTARIVSQKLSENLGVSVAVDNRPGAGSMMGTELAAKAAADGYTLITVAGEHSINPSLQPKVPYDAMRDFAPISQLISGQYFLSTHPSVPVKSVKEFIALAKARSGQLAYGSTGNGSITHIGNVLLQNMTATQLFHVPYKGGGPAAIALMSGEIDFLISATSAVMTQAKSGKLRAIAVTGRKRLPDLPQIPTVAESGVPGYEVTGWYMVLAPAGTPREIISKLHAEIARAVHDSTVKERFASFGTEPIGSSPEEASAFLRAEIDKWTPVVKASGARPD